MPDSYQKRYWKHIEFMDEIIRHYCSWITVNRLCNMDCFWCYDRHGEKASLNMHKDLMFDRQLSLGEIILVDEDRANDLVKVGYGRRV